MADAGAIATPTLLFVAEADWVVKKSAQETFFNRLSSPVKEMVTAARFLSRHFSRKGTATRRRRRRANLFGNVFKQTPQRDSCSRRTSAVLPRMNLTGFARPGNPLFGLIRFMMKTVGRLSRGIQLGWEAGFDSGRTLDYVYENQPRGITLLGRDRLTAIISTASAGAASANAR